MKRSSKIFCIGLNKTGTTSLHEAFKILGFRSVHFTCDKGNIKDIIKTNYEKGVDLLLSIDHFDAYSDWNHPSTNLLYKKLDQQYPNSKFILNIRNLEDWLLSREKHVKRIPNLKQKQKENPLHPWYNINKEAWRKEYESLHKDIHKYFETRKADLLVFDVTIGDAWEKLCPFLEVSIPKQAFPNRNKAPKRSYLRKIKNFLIIVRNQFIN